MSVIKLNSQEYKKFIGIINEIGDLITSIETTEDILKYMKPIYKKSIQYTKHDFEANKVPISYMYALETEFQQAKQKLGIA